jgi:DNA-binding transcriptional MerR regulator
VTMRRALRTAEVAAAVGVHPNTVRLYETWGLLPEIPRTPAGYRKFAEAHIDHMRLARMAFEGAWPGSSIRRAAVAVVKQAALGDLGGALELAYELLSVVQSEKAPAVSAVKLLTRWAQGVASDATADRPNIGETAALLGVSRDMLRNWERNGLVSVPRDARNGYRRYGAAEIGRLRVIRMLRRAGYSPMAILRMLSQLDRGVATDLGELLDTPQPDEDVYSAADRWLSALETWEARAGEMIDLLERMIEDRRRL